MTHKNILLIIADDLGKYIGAYGCTSVSTPSIDAFAKEGVRFDRAFASTASCSGSRSVIYTGLHTHENGQFGLNQYRAHFQTFENVDSAPKLFNEAGYLTGILGKVHVGPSHVYPWEWRLESDSRDVAWVADQAESFFERSSKEDRPFFLTVGYVDPHRDINTRAGFGNQEKYDSRVKPHKYDPATVEVPSWLTDDSATRQELAEYYEAVNRTDQGIGMMLEALKRQKMSDNTLVIITSDNGPPFINAKTTLYDAGTCLPFLVRCPGSKTGIVNKNMISYVDILPTLMEYAGIVDTAEHGYMMPSGGGPGPKGPQPSIPRSGQSFLSVIDREDEAPESEWQQHVFGSHTFHEIQNYWPTRVCRTKRFKYHRNISWKLDFPFASDLYASISFAAMRENALQAGKPPQIGKRAFSDYLHRPAEELYDLENDPDEIKNLAKDPKYESILLDMRYKVAEWQLRTRDLWLFRDGHSVIKMLRHVDEDLIVPDRFDMEVGLEGYNMVSPKDLIQ